MAMIVCERVSGNIMGVRGAQLSLNQVSFPALVATVTEVELCSVCFKEPNHLTVSLTGISLAYLVILFYETGLEALEVT